MVGRELELAADLKTLPERVQKERPEKSMRMMLFLRPRIGEEHVHRARMVRGQKVMEGVERLEPEDARVSDLPAPAFAVEQAHALEHALDAEKVAIGVLRRARGKELPLPAADFDLERTREIEVERLARIGDSDDMVCHGLCR